MAQAKYKALKAFDDFNPGDGVPALKVGDRADQLLADGFIEEPATELVVGPTTTLDPAATVAAGQAALNAQTDTEQRGLLGPYAAPMPSNLTHLAGAIDDRLLSEPPAVIGQALTAANTETAMRRVEDQAKKVQRLAVGNTLGPAEDVGGPVIVTDGAVTCPNCQRVVQDARRYVGSIIPCPCNYLIEITV